MTDDRRPHADAARGQKGSKNGLLKMGSPMSKWGLTPHIPSDIEESGHGKDEPNAYRLQPYPYGLSREKRPFCRRDISISYDCFWLTCLQLNSSPPFV